MLLLLSTVLSAFLLAPAADATGTLDLRTDPAGATVLLDARLLGVTPLQVQVPPGAYSVTLRREGSEEQTFPVRIVAGQRVSEVRTLRPAPPPAPGLPPLDGPPPGAEVPPRDPPFLEVYTDPPGATVYLDDEPLGESDPDTGRLVRSRLRPGIKRIRISKAGYDEAAREVEVAPEGKTEVRLALSPTPTALSPLAVAIAATAAAGLFLALRQRWRGTKAPVPSAPVSPTPVPALESPTGPGAAVTPRASGAGGALPWGGGEAEARERPAAGGGEPERFGDYLLRETLGRGGMASVYLAERGGELCALKRPHVAFLDDFEFRERFLREAEIGIALHHPNIVTILERGNVEAVPYFTMELLPGRTLQALLREEGPLAVRDACRVVSQVAEALDYAHLKGVVHRDLKPSNVMVLPDGSARVMDYGIARAQRFEGITATGAFLGTPDYVAPETAEGGVTDARSDLYSLGVMFYEMLTGRKPFVGETPFATLRMHVSEAPTPPSVVLPGTPPELEAIVLRLLAKDPNDRYSGAGDLLGELRAYATRAA